MAYATFTDGTDLTEGVVSEELLRELIIENRAPAVALAISREHNFRAQGASKSQRIVRIKNVASRTQSAEGDDLTVDDVDLDEETISPTTHYVARVITYQANKDFMTEVLPEVRAQALRAILESVDANGLAKFQDAIASVGSSSATMDLDLWASARYTWATLDTGGMPLFVGHNIHARDLTAAIRSTQAAIESTGRAASLFGSLSGFMGEYEGVPVFQSSNVSETGSAKIGAMISAGVLRYGVWNDLEVRMKDAPLNLAQEIVVWGRNGFTLATNGEASTGADSQVVKVLCKNT